MTESWETEYVQLLFNIFWTWISWCFTSSEGLRCIQREGWLAEIPGIWAFKASVMHSSPFCSECWMSLAEDLLWGRMLDSHEFALLPDCFPWEGQVPWVQALVLSSLFIFFFPWLWCLHGFQYNSVCISSRSCSCKQAQLLLFIQSFKTAIKR